MSGLRFPSVDEPLVSVVMVTYGNWPLVRRSLEALLERTDPVYEVIVVDSASPDDTAQKLTEAVEGASLVLSKENVGFGGGSNLGAEQARGRFLCFLNSDAIVEPGWLEPLIESLEEDPTTGAVVPMFLNPHGTIQEAGSVIDSVGWPHALGAGESPNAFAHRFRREIDYGSAACLLIERQSFWDSNGFDPAYGIGYFEDVDLSFKLKERGLRTIYEPRSRVVHERHGSGSSDQARRRMETNRAVFYRRWSGRLSLRPNLVDLPTSSPRLIAARDAEVVDRILVMDDRVPFHDRGSGDPRMAKMLHELVELWPDARITLAAADGSEAERYAEPLLARGIEVVAPPVDWQQWFERRMFHYSVAIVSRGQNLARFGGLLQLTQPQALRAFDTEALTFRRLERMVGFLEDSAEIAQVRAEATAMRQAELGALHQSEVIFAVSDEEADYIDEVATGKPTFVLPNWVATVPKAAGFQERKDLLFFGGFLAGAGSPNEDALLHLVNEVMPIIWEKEPDLRLHVVGADPTPAVQATHGERVNVVGYVEDPAEWLSRTRIHVSPMRYGSGIKLKLLDTIAAGQPFVTTAIGAEGLPLGSLRSVLVAEEPADLAELTHALYTDEQLWRRAQRGVVDIARNKFDRATFRRTLADAMSYLGVQPPEGVFAGAPYELAAARG
ncbi:MAG: glycosyltransferase [Actinomycetota bacterium]